MPSAARTIIASLLALTLCTGAVAAGGSATWTTKEPVEVEQNGAKDLTLVVLPDTSGEERVSVDIEGEIAGYVDAPESIRLTDQQKKLTLTAQAKDLEPGDSVSGTIYIVHKRAAQSEGSQVLSEYGFDLTIRVPGTVPSTILTNPAVLLMMVIGLLLVIGITYQRRSHTEPSGDRLNFSAD